MYGISNIDIEDLNLSEKTRSFILVATDLNDTYLNPLYQCFPSFWREKLCAYFNKLADRAYQSSCKDLGDRIELVKRYGEELKEDERLDLFLSYPVEYCLKNGISFGNDSDHLITKVREEEEIYLKFTEFVLSGEFEKAVLSNKKVLRRDKIIIGLDEEY